MDKLLSEAKHIRQLKQIEVVKKIKAESSKLHKNYWVLKNTEVINKIGEISLKEKIKIPTSITKFNQKEIVSI